MPTFDSFPARRGDSVYRLEKRSRMQIPRIIHQLWKDENVPARWRDAAASVKRYHKGWDYRLWTDALVDEHVRARSFPCSIVVVIFPGAEPGTDRQGSALRAPHGARSVSGWKWLRSRRLSRVGTLSRVLRRMTPGWDDDIRQPGFPRGARGFAPQPRGWFALVVSPSGAENHTFEIAKGKSARAKARSKALRSIATTLHAKG